MIPIGDEDPTLKLQICFAHTVDYLLRNLTEQYLMSCQDFPSLLHLHCLEKKKVIEREQQITALQVYIANQKQQINELQGARNRALQRRHRTRFPYPPRGGPSSGHRQYDPRLDNNLFASIICYGCGELGHIKRLCPNKQPTIAPPQGLQAED